MSQALHNGMPRAIAIRGPFERAARGQAKECVFCAIDLASLRWFGALAPLRRIPEQRRRQIAEVARWIASLQANCIIVLQAHVPNETYLTQILEHVQQENPTLLHSLRSAAWKEGTSFVADASATERLTMLRDILVPGEGTEQSLLQRIQRLNQVDPWFADTTARLAAAADPVVSESNSRALEEIAAKSQRTLVLGECIELAALRLRLERRFTGDETATRQERVSDEQIQYASS